MVSRHHGRYPEIRQLYGAVFVCEDVGAFDVSVNDTLRVQVDQALQHLRGVSSLK